VTVAHVVVCACGAESPASTRDDLLDAWEDDHTQWECPQALGTRWDDALECWRYPSLPAMTRHAADEPLEAATPTPINPRPATGRRHLRRPA